MKLKSIFIHIAIFVTYLFITAVVQWKLNPFEDFVNWNAPLRFAFIWFAFVFQLLIYGAYKAVFDKKKIKKEKFIYFRHHDTLYKTTKTSILSTSPPRRLPLHAKPKTIEFDEIKVITKKQYKKGIKKIELLKSLNQ